MLLGATGEEVVTCKLYLGLAFTIPTLERVTIGCCEVGGGGGGYGVVGGVGVVCGDGVDRGVGGVDCGVVCGFVKAPVSTMIVSVPEKDRWCGARGKDVIVDGGGGEDIKHVYNTDIITVDQGRCEKWGMKLTKEVVNRRCLSYSIHNPTVFSLNT
ncbi:hypothetical protein Tco_0665557 [Tanacetum coccineum]